MSSVLTGAERLAIQRAVEQLTGMPSARDKRDLSSVLNCVEAEVEGIVAEWADRERL